MTFPPEWHALGREAELAAEQLASGVTFLGRANHAQRGLYNQAFFALSIGFERLAKLILVTDHALDTRGQWLTDQELKRKGHDIGALLNACEPISEKHLTDNEWRKRPNSPIHGAITSQLTEFAKLTRYYNLASLSGGGPARSTEPVDAWWNEVGAPILECHYRPAQRELDDAQAMVMDHLLGGSVMVLHHDEAGRQIATVEDLMRRRGATRVVQRYGRLYVLQLVRWLSATIAEISHQGAYHHRMIALLGLDERFQIFRNEDRYLRDRKTWSIYRP